MGAQRARNAEDLIRARLALLLLAALAIAGCGDDGSESEGGASLPRAGGGGVVGYAIDELPRAPAGIDPLTAPAGALAVSHQIHEPLFSRVDAPYGEAFQRGLMLALKPSDGGTVWTASLRSGVRFQDGTPFNAAAVLANARRWTSVPEGRRLLPGLFAADAPRPGQVRFLFRRGIEFLGSRLASARLGIVSPLALQPQSGEGARLVPDAVGSGTGAFELGPTEDGRLSLRRNPEWWGSPLGLGPALDGVDFVRAPTEALRVQALLDGRVQIAGGLSQAQTTALSTEALTRVLPRRGLAYEASVEGLHAAGSPPALSGVWLTAIQD